MRRSARLLLGMFLLAGCAQQDGPRQAPEGSTAVQPRVVGAAETVVPLPAAAAMQQAEAALRARGFTISGLSEQGRPLEAANGGVTDASWAVCPRITIRDEFSEAFRSRHTEASGFDTRVTVVAVPVSPTETRLIFRTLNIGTYINSFSNTEQQSSCRSTGTLERQLVEAVRTEA